MRLAKLLEDVDFFDESGNGPFVVKKDTTVQVSDFSLRMKFLLKPTCVLYVGKLHRQVSRGFNLLEYLDEIDEG